MGLHGREGYVGYVMVTSKKGEKVTIKDSVFNDLL